MSNRLEILKVRGRNFLSIGTILEFDFDSHKGLNYIYGQNNDIKTKSNQDESEEAEEIRNGSGKCVAAETEIDIEFATEETKKLFLDMINNNG